ncbi:CpsD/CapB family tyrosine-protein kinase [Alkalicoccus urumqiensis]|uniref:non-specific protein-tyrosine kinase n=1 Tax=Alkalicoccus urumqiensis TaxID=1548213 RepID=A0A2P6MHQ9_ALKUR|nr:CpsD/CapB family tyrosine-protein kinase [Alkalicoccus urumqiensis]PRO65829.1 capsular biosynthesis protein [Alkalicoccus urumqiensis]
MALNLFRKKKKDHLTEKQRSLIAHFSPKSPISEQYRTIRTNIQFASMDHEVRLLAVTSTAPGEGKSTTAANLATVFAQQDARVLLIDADLRKPTGHYTFQVDNTTGLTNVLTNQAKLEEVTSSTVVPALDILTCGPIPPNPAELLSSKRMDWLLTEARQQYDIIIIDTPPVLAVTDAQVIGNQADGVVLVTSSGTTKQEDAQKAKELLENASANVLGVVLNRKERTQGSYYYYYGN